MIRDEHPAVHMRMVAEHLTKIRRLFPDYTAEQAMDEALTGDHVPSIEDAWLAYAAELEAGDE